MHTLRRRSPPDDLGAQIVAPKWLFLSGLVSGDGIDLILEFRGVLLNVSFYSNVGLDSGFFYFNNFKSGTRNATEFHKSGRTGDLVAPVCVCV